MSGNTAGGMKVKAKVLAADPDYFKRIGGMGGKAKVAKGFATMTPEQRSAAGRKGGKISKRPKHGEVCMCAAHVKQRAKQQAMRAQEATSNV